MGFVCAMMVKKGSLPRFAISCVLGGAIMVVGYGVYEWFVFGWSYAITAVPFNLIQWAGGVIGAIALYYPVKRIKGATLS